VPHRNPGAALGDVDAAGGHVVSVPDPPAVPAQPVAPRCRTNQSRAGVEAPSNPST
jgi:hypothetical protein